MTIQHLNPNEHTRISAGSKVSLHFKVSLENGIEIDSTFSRPEPVNLVIGDGNLMDGFENVLMGLRSGDKRTASLAPDEAFGQWNKDNLQTFDKTTIEHTTGGEPELGQMIEFADKGQNTLAGVVSEVQENNVVVDFNHPLAGQTILFTVEIVQVTPAGVNAVRFS